MAKALKTKRKPAAAAKRGTKGQQIIGLLSRPGGASIAELMKATGWQAHSVRGFLAGSLKKQGHVVSSSMDVGGERRYRLAGGAL